jgi:hypothetical protein
MAIIYYPKSSFVFKRDTLSASYEQVSINVAPNTILYFDTSSNLNALSASTFYLTASNATSASYALTTTIANVALIADQSLTSSYLEGNAKVIGGIQFDTASVVSISKEGYVFWDNGTHTLAIKPNITASTLQVGHETWLNYLAGEDISNGDALYITTEADGDNGHPVCKRAVADGGRVKYAVVAIATNDAASGSHNIATIQGTVNDLNMAMYPQGMGLFLSETTPGKFRMGPPSEPYERVFLGYCANQDAINGRFCPTYLESSPELHHNHPLPIMGMVVLLLGRAVSLLIHYHQEKELHVNGTFNLLLLLFR